MAFERLNEKKAIATNLDGFISNQLFLISQQKIRRNLMEEDKFNRAVLENDLPLEDQIEWRQAQLAKVGNDKDEKRRIEQDISALKERKIQEDFDNAYLQQITDMNAGLQGVESTISFLNNELRKTKDSAMKTKIKTELSLLKKKKFENQQSMLANQTTYAQNSQSESIIQKQIKQVNASRVRALESGQDEYASVLDLQLQSLNMSLATAKISKTMTDLSVATATGQSAVALLDSFNNEIENADPNTPVVIGEQRYESAQQFWQSQRTQYLNDRSANGFFGRYQGELKEKVDYQESNRLLSNSTLSQADSWYKEIETRPELADYQERLVQDKQQALQYTGDKRANQALAKFSQDLDAANALDELAYMQDQYGINLSSQFQQVIKTSASEKQQQVADIISTMYQIQADNPGISNQAALQQAIKAGAATFVSPEEFATMSAEELAKKTTDVATNETGVGTSPLDVTKAQTEKFSSAPSLKEGGLYKGADGSTVFKYENGALRPFTGNFTDEEFKQTAGKGFDAVETVNINSIPKGQAIVKDQTVQQNNQTPEQQQSQDNTLGAYIPDPGLLKDYSQDQIVKRGDKIYLKPGVQPTWDRPVEKQEETTFTEDQVIRTENNTYLRKNK